jgi:hypothetical protein
MSKYPTPDEDALRQAEHYLPWRYSKKAIAALWKKYLATCQAKWRRQVEQAKREPHRQTFWYRAGIIDRDGNPLPLSGGSVVLGWPTFLEEERKAMERWKTRRERTVKAMRERKAEAARPSWRRYG